MLATTHHEGSTAGLHVYGSSQCYTYSLPGTLVPRPLYIEGFQGKYNSGMYRDRLVAWASGNNNNITTTTSSTPTRARKASKSDPMTPFVASAAFPNDIPRLVDIEFAAFADEKVNHQLSYRDASNPKHAARTIRFYAHCMEHLRSPPLPLPPTHSQQNHQNLRSAEESNGFGSKRGRSDGRINGSKPSLGYRFRKVTDPRTGEIIAFAKTEMAALSRADLSAPLDVGHESEPRMNRAWFALNERLHREYNGARPHCYFGMLATHPAHQHRGAATMLMDELVAEADALGLEIYCEATRTGRALYEKYGFEVVRTLVFDPAAYEVEGLGVETQSVMVRGALGADGVRRPVRAWDIAAAEVRAEAEGEEGSEGEDSHLEICPGESVLIR